MNDYDGYGWIKVKKHKFDSEKSWEENYKDLENHHVEETTFLIDEVRKVAQEKQQEPGLDDIVKATTACIDLGYVESVSYEICRDDDEDDAVFVYLKLIEPNDGRYRQTIVKDRIKIQSDLLNRISAWGYDHYVYAKIK